MSFMMKPRIVLSVAAAFCLSCLGVAACLNSQDEAAGVGVAPAVLLPDAGPDADLQPADGIGTSPSVDDDPLSP